MAAQRAASDPETTSFEATVTAVDDDTVRLDRTYFYAESGGQPADRGTLAGIRVTDVEAVADGIVHTLAEPAPFGAGETIEGSIDTTFRTYCRRAHSASHVLYGVARELLDDLGYGGFDIGEEKVRIDFETTTDIDDAVLIALSRQANLAVWESRPITWEHYPLDTVRELPGVAFNTKTEEGVFDAAEDVRIVEIGGATMGDDETWLDRAACGGTHVRNTRDIGPIAVLDRSNPGEGLTRIEIAVGPTAIAHQTTFAQTSTATAHALNVGIPDVPDRVRQLQEAHAALEADLQAMQEQHIHTQVANASCIERNGATWIIEPTGIADTDVLSTCTRDAVGSDCNVIVLVSDTSPVTVVVSSDGAIDAGDVVDEMTEAFGGGGGGGAAFAQAGGMDVEPERLVSYFTE